MIFLVFQKNHVFGIGATIRIGQESLCLPYAGFFLFLLYFLSINEANRTNQDILCLPYAYLTHRCSQAVLQTALLFSDSFIEWVSLYEFVSKPTSLLDFSLSYLSYKFYGAEILTKVFFLQHVSNSTCCMSCGMCHMSRVQCNVSHVSCLM